MVHVLAGRYGHAVAALRPTVKGLQKLRLRRREMVQQSRPMTQRGWAHTMRELALDGSEARAAAGLMWVCAMRAADLPSLSVPKADITFTGAGGGTIRVVSFASKEAKLRGLPTALEYHLPPSVRRDVRAVLGVGRSFTEAAVALVLPAVATPPTTRRPPRRRRPRGPSSGPRRLQWAPTSPPSGP